MSRHARSLLAAGWYAILPTSRLCSSDGFVTHPCNCLPIFSGARCARSLRKMVEVTTMPIRIIIADDEPIIRIDLKEELTRQGYLVVGEAVDGVSAVNQARELRPDLVVMDIRMPELDGITAAETLTREKIAPVVLVTAYNDEDLIERAKSAGVVNYIVKPWRQSDIRPAIEIALARFAEFRTIEKQAKDLQDQLATRKVVERAKGLLMQKYGLSEQDAFRRIQKLSMNNRKSMREVAEAILLTSEISDS